MDELTPTELALLNRIFLTEIWMNYSRGATLAELCEAFFHIRDSPAKVRGRVNYLLQGMVDRGIIEHAERAEPVPRKFFRTTERGRITWLTTSTEDLTRVKESFNDSSSFHESDDESEHPDAESQ